MITVYSSPSLKNIELSVLTLTPYIMNVQYNDGYHEYIEGCSVHWGFQYKLKGFITLLPHMHQDLP